MDSPSKSRSLDVCLGKRNLSKTFKQGNGMMILLVERVTRTRLETKTSFAVISEIKSALNYRNRNGEE